MGRYTGPKNKIARRFGVNLGLKTNAAKVARRLTQPPGAHGPNKRRRTRSSFGKQLDEKQKAKFMYGIRERQFRSYVEEANRREGDSGVNLHQLLESRFDNVIYRMGIATTRAQARQFVNHGMFVINGKKMDIPSYQVKVGDEVSLKENKKQKVAFEGLTERLSNAQPPSWVSVDPSHQSGKVISTPTKDDVESVFDVKLIIEYYATR